MSNWNNLVLYSIQLSILEQNVDTNTMEVEVDDVEDTSAPPSAATGDVVPLSQTAPPHQEDDLWTY